MPLKNRGLKQEGSFTKKFRFGIGIGPTEADGASFLGWPFGAMHVPCLRENAADMGEASAVAAQGDAGTDTAERDLAWSPATGQPSEAGTERGRMNPQPRQSWFQEASRRGCNRFGPQSGKPTAGL